MTKQQLAQVMKIEAGCLALEQAAIGTPDDPVPADLQGMAGVGYCRVSEVLLCTG